MATRTREKREFYLEIGVPEYWIVDGAARTIRVVRPDQPDMICEDSLNWAPFGAPEPLVLDVRAVFREARGESIAR